MIAIGLLKAVWKPLAGLVLLAGLYFAWNSFIASVEQRGHKAGYVAGIYDGTKAGYIKGHGAAVDERQDADNAELGRATEEAFKGTIVLQKRYDQQSHARKKEKVKYEAEISDLRDAARRGDSGLRVPAETCAARSDVQGATAAPSPGPAGGPSDTAPGIDLLPETAENILSAAADLRQSVRERNELIEKYNECRAVANTP